MRAAAYQGPRSHGHRNLQKLLARIDAEVRRSEAVWMFAPLGRAAVNATRSGPPLTLTELPRRAERGGGIHTAPTIDELGTPPP